LSASDKLRKLARASDEVVFKVNLDYLLDDIPKIIRVRTRLGKGVKDGKATRLKALKSSTKKHRERYKGELSPETSPSRSGLTATGQMLESIAGKISKATGSLRVIFLITGKRTKELSGSSPTSTNDDIARYAREKGRPFFNLTDSERNGIQRKVAQTIKKAVRELFKRS
jgi:hypothetical protein